MSKKKTARRVSTKGRDTSNHVDKFHSKLAASVSFVKLALIFVLSSVFGYFRDTFTTWWRKMVNNNDGDAGVQGSSGPQASSGTGSKEFEKKRARILNKQNKMLAEYRLVCGKSTSGTSGAPAGAAKKRKVQEALGDEDFKHMKKELAERKRMLQQLPRFWINSSVGCKAAVFQTPYATRTPLLLSDIEHLVTYAYGGNALVPPPSRWSSLQKPNRLISVVVLVVGGVGLSEFVDNEDAFSATMQIFGGRGENRAIVEFLSPAWYNGTLESEIRNWGIIGCCGSSSSSSENKQSHHVTIRNTTTDFTTPCKDDPTMSAHAKKFQTVMNQLASVFPISSDDDSVGGSVPCTDSFPRTALILTLPQLLQENYPLPIPSNALSKIMFERTSDQYRVANARSKMFSIDCEMCCSREDPQVLTKIGIVDEQLNTVYETLVKPEYEITDYLTRWSGITEEMLVGVEVTLADVQRRIKQIVHEFPDCVFVGQSLNCDMKAIRMTHPYVIDTSVIFNLKGVEGRKSSLKDLSWNLLREGIQEANRGRQQAHVVGHCPVEDAAAAMKLVKRKLDMGFNFGNAVHNSSFLTISSKLALDPALTGNSFKQSKLDKNVLLVCKSDVEEEQQEIGSSTCSSSSSNTDGSDQSQEPPPPSLKNPSECSSNASASPRLVTEQVTGSNGDTVKTLSTSVYDHYMSVGFYKMDSEDLRKGLNKLDKRVKKLYDGLPGNSLFIVLCSHEGVEDASSYGNGGSSSAAGTFSRGEGAERKNNGVAFIKCKVTEHVAGRRSN